MELHAQNVQTTAQFAVLLHHVLAALMATIHLAAPVFYVPTIVQPVQLLLSVMSALMVTSSLGHLVSNVLHLVLYAPHLPTAQNAPMDTIWMQGSNANPVPRSVSHALLLRAAQTVLTATSSMEPLARLALQNAKFALTVLPVMIALKDITLMFPFAEFVILFALAVHRLLYVVDALQDSILMSTPALNVIPAVLSALEHQPVRIAQVVTFWTVLPVLFAIPVAELAPQHQLVKAVFLVFTLLHRIVFRVLQIVPVALIMD